MADIICITRLNCLHLKVSGVLHLQLLGPSPEFDKIVSLEIRKYMNVDVID
jgi:hypothetical protein